MSSTSRWMRAPLVLALMSAAVPALAEKQKQKAAAPEGPSRVLVASGFGLAGVGIFGGLALAIAGGVRSGEANDLLTTLGDQPRPCRQGGTVCAEIESLREEQGALLNASLWTFVGGVGFAVATSVYLMATTNWAVFGELRLTPVVGPSHVGVGLAGSL